MILYVIHCWLNTLSKTILIYQLDLYTTNSLTYQKYTMDLYSLTQTKYILYYIHISRIVVCVVLKAICVIYVGSQVGSILSKYSLLVYVHDVIIFIIPLVLPISIVSFVLSMTELFLYFYSYVIIQSYIIYTVRI